MLGKLQEVKKEYNELVNNISVKKDIDDIKVKFLGKKGKVTSLLKSIGSLSIEEKKEIGKKINEFKQELEKDIDNRYSILEEKLIDEKIKSEIVDISINKGRTIGKKHILSVVLEEISDIFLSMGYSIKEGPDIELSSLNFDALNTPADHPARDLQDTFYINPEVILRTQTSPVQARTMMSEDLPIKIIAPGRVYRSDDVDATHSPMFHQVEGLVVGENITMADLKGTLELFAKTYFGEDTKIRLRPHYFPFTEPSAEVDVSCFVCGGKGCRVCKEEGWIEILGAGMVHPNVLEYSGIDSKKYTGFAFGLGLERCAMIKYGINDLRYLYDNDVRFLNQF